MSWNPLKKISLTRQSSGQSLIHEPNERDLDRHIAKLQQLDEVTKKLHKDMKRAAESIADLSKYEQKITQNLSASPLCNYDDLLRNIIEEYYSASVQTDQSTNDLIMIYQKAVLEPIKRFGNISTHLNTVLKKREHLKQECQKCQMKVEKQQEKEKTGPNIVKLEQLKRLSVQSQENLADHNYLLMDELPKLYSGRIGYFQPSLETLILGQVNYYGESTKLFAEHIQTTKHVPSAGFNNDAFNQQCQQKLNEIRGLSIIAND